MSESTTSAEQARLDVELLNQANAFGAKDNDDIVTLLKATAQATLTPENAAAAMRDFRARKPHLFIDVMNMNESDYQQARQTRLATPVAPLDLGDVRNMSHADYQKAKNMMIAHDYAVTAERVAHMGSRMSSEPLGNRNPGAPPLNADKPVSQMSTAEYREAKKAFLGQDDAKASAHIKDRFATYTKYAGRR